MAKGNGLTLKALLQLSTREFEKGLSRVKKQLNGFGNFLKSAFAVGSITAFGKQMVNVSKDFEDSITRVKAITNATQDEFNNMRKAALKMGETTRYTASEAAAALENLTRNGMTASQATKALSGVMQLAQANAIGLAEAADIVTNSLNMFGLSVDQTNRVNDVLSSTAANAATNITDLYEALVNAAPAANVLGFQIEEVSAAIGALAQKGVKGADAGTQLRMSLTKMADPKIVKKMQEMGVAIDEETMKSEGLLKTIKRLKDAQLSLTDLVAIFSQRGAVGMQQLISAYEDFDRMLNITRNSAGTTARMFEQGVGTTRKELDTLKSMYEGLLLTIGNKTSGVFNGTVKLLQNLINNFKSFGGTLANIASVVVPLLVRKIVMLGKTAGSTLAGIKAGVAGVKAAMGGWVTIVATLVTWIGTALYGAWAKVNQPIKDAQKNLGEVVESSRKLRIEASNLINKLGPETDDMTLAGVIKRLCELYPEFNDQIQNSYRLAGQTGNWEALRRVLQDVVDLQEQVSLKQALGERYDAETLKLAEKMYQTTDTGGHGYGAQAGPSGFIVTKETNTIRKALEAAGYEAEDIRRAFKEIAKISTDAKQSELTKVQKIHKYLYEYYDRLEPGIGVSDIRPYIRMAEEVFGKTFSNPASTSHSMAKADSTMNDRLFDWFEQDSLMVKQKLEANAITDKQYHNEMKRLATDLIQSVDESALTFDQKDLLAELRKEYGTSVSTPTTPGGSGGSGGGAGGGKGKAAKTETELLTEVITGYTKSAQELKNQLDAGAITLEHYNESIDELNEKTYRSITAFDNFQTLLDGMPAELQDVSKAIGDAFASKQIEAAIQKAIAQRLDLNGYYATQGKRDTTYDYLHDGATQPGQTFSPLQKHAMEGQLNVTLDYADALQRLIDDLRKGIADGDFDLVKDEAIEQLQKLEGEFDKAKREATSFQHVLNFSEAQEQLVELQEQLRSTTISGVEELARAFGSVNGALFDIIELFDEDVKDSEFYKGLEAMMTVMNSLITIFQTFQGVIEAVGTAKKLLAQISKQTAAQEVAADLAVASAEGTKAAASAGAAAAGAGSSVASVPIVGPILAVAAIGTVVAAILAAMSKFATGGIVGGNSMTGDHNVVRANSGEMILTKGQQSTLFSAIQSGNLGGGRDVRFILKGTDLIGSIENTQARRRG